MKMGVPILGTSAEDVDAAEDRELFDEILEKCEIPRAKGQTVFTVEEALKGSQRTWLSCTRKTFICTWWTGYADCCI